MSTFSKLEINTINIHSSKLTNTSGKHTIWFVSDCDHTNGATARMTYAKSLIKEGIKLDGYGVCFGNELRDGFAPWGKDGMISKYKEH